MGHVSHGLTSVPCIVWWEGGREGGLHVRKKLCVVGGIYAAMNAHSIASTGF